MMSTKSSLDKLVGHIFDWYRKFGQNDYIGEDVTQLEHAAQCAMLAEQDGQSYLVILGAFLHDIGHLLEVDDANHMYTKGIRLGVIGHERKGEQYLKELGLPSMITDIVRGHVDAKRYLCYKNSEYYNNLSPASKMTLEHQGGPMEREEAGEFENNPHFEIMIKARKWDECAKVKDRKIPPISFYENMLKTQLQDIKTGK